MARSRGQPVPVDHIPVDRTGGPAYAAAMTEPAFTLDAVGLLCPLPVLKARKHLLSLPPGAVLELLASDPAAVVDVPHFCAEAGHALIEKREVDGHQSYLIRKGG